ncbi:MAG: pyridoxal phosphate-dependent aminotransferase [Caulobacteraceae bacterium]
MNFHGGYTYKYNNELLDFSSNINPLGVPESFRGELERHMEDFTKYPDAEYRNVRRSIAEYLDISDYDSIIPGNGAVELIYKLIASSGSSGIVSLSPTFSEYGRAAAINRMGFYEVPAYNEEFTAIEMDKLLKYTKPGTMVVICNPNNPTGTLIKKADMQRLAERLEVLNCSLLIDEAFMEFTDGYPADGMIGMLERFKNVTVIKAATKFFGMPGIRLGYAVTFNKNIQKNVRAICEPWNLNTAAVIAAGCIFRDEEYIKRSREWIKTERRYLFEGLCSIRGLKVYASEANFHLLKIQNEKLDAYKLHDALIEKGILIRLPEGFNNLSGYHFRLAVKDRASNNFLIRVLSEVMSKYV